MILPEQPKPTSPAKAIRAYCLSCCCESSLEVKLCPAEECPLHPFRMGKNPFRKTHELTEEHKQKLQNARAKLNIEKSLQTEEENEAESPRSINSHLDTSFEEKALSRNEYPVYPDFPEEQWD